MRISKSMFAYMALVGCLCLVGFVTPVAGQAPAVGQAPAGGHGILGTLDPQTGTFKPLIRPTVIEDLETAATSVVPTTGEFNVKFTITVKSTIPSGDVIACSVSADVIDITTSYFADESATVAATRSGSSATCTVTIPYSWRLATPATDTYQLTYTIYTPAAGTVGVSSTSGLPSRVSTQTIGTAPVPASGKTTNINWAATI